LKKTIISKSNPQSKLYDAALDYANDPNNSTYTALKYALFEIEGIKPHFKPVMLSEDINCSGNITFSNDWKEAVEELKYIFKKDPTATLSTCYSDDGELLNKYFVVMSESGKLELYKQISDLASSRSFGGGVTLLKGWSDIAQRVVDMQRMGFAWDLNPESVLDED